MRLSADLRPRRRNQVVVSSRGPLLIGMTASTYFREDRGTQKSIQLYRSFMGLSKISHHILDAVHIGLPYCYGRHGRNCSPASYSAGLANCHNRRI
jgi:hypothetical protein